MTMEQLTLSIGLLAVLVVIILVGCVGIYNRVQRLINMIPEIASNISVLVKKRTDLISKLISIVDSYGLHESGVNLKIADEFGGAGHHKTTSGVVERLASLRMAFPELKADHLYGNLIQQLEQVETDIADRRERYNSIVRAYNTHISQFPNNLLLPRLGFKAKEFIAEDRVPS